LEQAISKETDSGQLKLEQDKLQQVTSKRAQLEQARDDHELLKEIEQRIDALAEKGRFEVELKIPHAGALGDVEAAAGSSKYESLEVKAVGSDKVRVTSESMPDCNLWTQFLKDVRDIAWRPRPIPPVDRIYYLDGSKLAAALNGVGNPTGEVAKAAGSAAQAQSTSKKGAVNASKPGSEGGGSGGGKAQELSIQTAGAPAVPDMVIFREPHPGDDAVVAEKSRVVAALDLPRPEMFVGAWSLQLSSAKPQDVVEWTRKIRTTIYGFDQNLQRAIFDGWKVLEQYAADKSYYDRPFHDYLALRYVGDSPKPNGPQGFLDYHTGVTVSEAARTNLDVCKVTRYCLGYTELFHPSRPNLMTMLLTVIAAAQPMNTVMPALYEMEGRPQGTVTKAPSRETSCLETDFEDYGLGRRGPFFECFREATNSYLRPPETLGLVRSAIANFLFNYKMAFLFPHEFSAYDLDHSADALNAALSPFVTAFNQDIAAYQMVLMNSIRNGTGLGKNSKAFSNSGLVNVRTVSGTETTVDTVTQTYLDTTKAPTIPEVLTSMENAESATPAILKSGMGAAVGSAVAGAVGSMQSSEAKIGRGFTIKLMPHSLPAASSAELEIKMNAAETAEPTLYYAGSANGLNDNLSRVGKHETTTKVRIDSLRIFEVSSFFAQLQRSRSRFPILPVPGLEVPYIGSLVGVPRRPGTEYHASIAVLGAIVVPTAADLAYGTSFEADRIVESETANFVCTWGNLDKCLFRVPESRDDLGTGIWKFHQMMLNCLTSSSVTVASLGDSRQTRDKCAEELDMSHMPNDAQ
jgi:hypothetical protein